MKKRKSKSEQLLEMDKDLIAYWENAFSPYHELYNLEYDEEDI